MQVAFSLQTDGSGLRVLTKGKRPKTKIISCYLPIDLFGLYILFSQYRSCDNTQEAWSFVLFIKKSACRHIHACMPSF